MGTRYFVDQNGAYLGGFDGQTTAQLNDLLPVGAIELAAPPEHGYDIYNPSTQTWTPYVQPQDLTDPVAVKVIKALLSAGVLQQAQATDALTSLSIQDASQKAAP